MIFPLYWFCWLTGERFNHFANIVLHLQRVGTGSIRQSVQNGQFLCCLAENASDLFVASHADPPANAGQTASSLRSVHATSLWRRPLLQHPTSLPDRQPRLRRFVMSGSFAAPAEKLERPQCSADPPVDRAVSGKDDSEDD